MRRVTSKKLRRTGSAPGLPRSVKLTMGEDTLTRRAFGVVVMSLKEPAGFGGMALSKARGVVRRVGCTAHDNGMTVERAQHTMTRESVPRNDRSLFLIHIPSHHPPSRRRRRSVQPSGVCCGIRMAPVTLPSEC